MKPVAPSVGVGQRAIVAGRTGSGKSTLANYLLKNSPSHWVILNPKITSAYNRLPNSTVIEGFNLKKIEASIFSGKKFTVVNPTRGEANSETMDLFVSWIHDNFMGVGLCADELYTLHKNGRPGEGLLALLTRGRELKQSFIGLTQRPAWVSQFVFSEADYIGQMSLNIPGDRKRMYEFIGNPMALENIPPRHWLWYDVGGDKLRYFNPVPP